VVRDTQRQDKYAYWTSIEGNLVVIKMIVSAVVLDVLEIYLNLDGIWDRHYHEVGHYFNHIVYFWKELGANVCTPSNLNEVADTAMVFRWSHLYLGPIPGCVPGEKKSLTMILLWTYIERS
jgi:hypothetical protein